MPKIEKEIKEKKIRYEPPALIELGEISRGIGDVCSTGNIPLTPCSTGGENFLHCGPGTLPDLSECGTGPSADVNY